MLQASLQSQPGQGGYTVSRCLYTFCSHCSEASQFANFGDNPGASSFTTCGAVSYSKQKVGSVVTMFVETRHVGICKVQVKAMLKNQNNRTR